MDDQILIINAGSSSIKFALFSATPEPQRALHGIVSGLGAVPAFEARDADGQPLSGKLPDAAPTAHASALAWLFEWLKAQSRQHRIVAAGHRVVHGGARFAEPLQLDTHALAELEKLVPMAPLHQPHNLAAIRALMTLRPDLPQVACFDTAFHRTQSTLAQHFALPRELSATGVHRYGFHGLSYEYVAGVLPRYLGGDADGRVVVAHLGNGASLCATHHRRSVATTMGFTALDGLMMGTRCGNLDPGVIFYLMREQNMSAAQVEDLLYRRSGLLGVSGISSDMRELLASRSPEAREAVDLFCYRIVRELGSMVAALGGLDALVFTAGIGEHSPEIRAMICEKLHWLGILIDESANQNHGPTINTTESRLKVCVIPTNEEAVVAKHTAKILGLR